MKQDHFGTAQATLLEPTGLSASDLDAVMQKLTGVGGCDFADMYFQYAKQESWSLDEGVVKTGSFTIDQGVGLRTVCGEKTAFAYSEDLHAPAILAAADVVQAIGRQGGGTQAPRAWRPRTPRALYPQQDPIAGLGDAEKVAILEAADRAARGHDPRVVEVMASLAGVYEVVLIVTSDGRQVPDVRPLIRLNVSVIVEQDGKRERGSMGGGGRFGFDYFDHSTIEHYAHEAVRQALVSLEAIDSPAGTMPVVLGPGWPGILLHEAVGHGLEGDFNRKGTSAFSGRIGQRVASELCTVVDDGTIAERRGSLSVDDEGNETQNTVLIEKGILKGYMQDEHNARLMGMSVTGNGRRESFAHLPMPRMTNTYMHNGEHDPEEIIRSVKKGLYAVNFGGGQVDITSGKFVFSSSEAYLIEDGKITAPVKGATLIGNGPEAMQTISMVGNDMSLDSGVGVCGKDGQSVPVGVGQPTLKMDALTVGGVQL
ncbi:TldD protein [Arenicella chitinivorans]|uniref:TldD protein n=1 Tax=Arenicella chitinivorans TaxID=1329800 RepID=A0A918RWC9_9GAMM|nr:metalloprotease TldD [Arenicella chitinivorans]GHA11765.1 TldD protein [Arenicella chitinivorans]